jgi:predicted RNA binding protein YcfA (HicA-like mRNA interferase family)
VTPKLPVVRASDVVRVAQRLRFVFDRQRGSHAVYRRPSDGARDVIPLHSGRDLKPKTLAGILDDLGITPDQLRALI